MIQLYIFLFVFLLCHVLFHREPNIDYLKKHYLSNVLLKWMGIYTIGLLALFINSGGYRIFMYEYQINLYNIFTVWLLFSMMLDIFMNQIKIKFESFYKNHRAWIYIIYISIQFAWMIYYFRGFQMWAMSYNNNNAVRNLFIPLNIILLFYLGIQMDVKTNHYEFKNDWIIILMNIVERIIIVYAILRYDYFLITLPISLRILMTLYPKYKKHPLDSSMDFVLNILLGCFVSMYVLFEYGNFADYIYNLLN